MKCWRTGTEERPHFLLQWSFTKHLRILSIRRIWQMMHFQLKWFIHRTLTTVVASIKFQLLGNSKYVIWITGYAEVWSPFYDSLETECSCFGWFRNINMEYYSFYGNLFGCFYMKLQSMRFLRIASVNMSSISIDFSSYNLSSSVEIWDFYFSNLEKNDFFFRFMTSLEGNSIIILT